MARRESVMHRAWRRFHEDHCTLLAAAIGFYVLFSFVPLVTLLLALLGYVLRDPALQQRAVDRMLETFPLQYGPGTNLVLDTVRQLALQTPGLTVVGAIGLLWASSGMFGSIRSALNIAWGAEPRHGVVLQRLADVGSVFGLGLMLLVSMAASIAVHLAQGYPIHVDGVLAGSLGRLWFSVFLLAPAVISYLTFLLLYRNVPNVRHGVADVWPGALFAAVLFEIGKHAFAFYVSHYSHLRMVNGVLGGVMLFMLWAYVASLIMLMGAEIASEYEEHRHEHDAVEEPLPHTASVASTGAGK